MACIITFKDGGFTAPVGGKFAVDVTPPAGGGLAFLHVIYGEGDPVKAAPYSFEIQKGVKNLHVFYSASSADQQGKTFTLVEVCGANQQTLALNNFDLADPHFAAQIEGV